MVAKRHRDLGERSQARANIAMRVLRALFNFAAGEYEDENGQSLILENPVNRLSHTRAWYRVDRRKSVIKAHDLAKWYHALLSVKKDNEGYQHSTICDYLLVILLTGLRRTEAMQLKWENIDFDARSLTVMDTKNHENHELPLSDHLYDLLKNRHEEAYSPYVFPGDGKRGHIIEPRKTMNKITECCGVTFTLHDLRRTFITIAESLDIPAYALKRLLNHKMNQDVTAGYIISDIERLRRPMQMVTDYLMEKIKAQ
jgi:integrase